MGPGARVAGCSPDRLPFSSQDAPVAIAVAVVAASGLLLLLLRRTGRRASGLVTLQDPLAKYPLQLVDKEVSERPGRPRALEPPPSSRLCGGSCWPLCCPAAVGPLAGGKLRGRLVTGCPGLRGQRGARSPEGAAVTPAATLQCFPKGERDS